MTIKTMIACFAAATCAIGAKGAIDIDTGRQLFVDDCLVESTDGVVRHWNKPVKMENPLVWPKGGAAPRKTDGSSKAKKGDEIVNLTCATDGGKKWKEVLVVDPDDFWPRRPENVKLALEDGKLVWSWVDRVSWNKDGAEQNWRLVLDAEKEPAPDSTFKAELH